MGECLGPRIDFHDSRDTDFLAPTRDHPPPPPPPTGAVRLGNLTKSPRTPEYPLNNLHSPTLQLLLASSHRTHEVNAYRSLSSTPSIHPTIWALFLASVLGPRHRPLRQLHHHLGRRLLHPHPINPRHHPLAVQHPRHLHQARGPGRHPPLELPAEPV
ncbi:hypothetical protein B0T25DRAFT_7862 [Lasiosphaeria hispida]|uniref:Uncharacterized protein n=1 Tax=Lasiosphaeria hispida TaxID=260671 RepID=A0AAJ0HTB7_9PEZI|nr:hypothetical protein B0T25DRAFT_7862 [Lasiosphaeria hispida]